MKLLIASSATGGHIYPALAIADEVRRRDPQCDVLFVGAAWEIGKDIVGASGYRQVIIDVSGFDRRNLFKNFAVLRDLARASAATKKILHEFAPDVCLGTGGHIAGPVIREARKAGIRTIIQEQNLIPGVANKLAERYSDKVFVGFEETGKYFRDTSKLVVSGNPVRAEFAQAAADRKGMREKYGVSDEDFCVLFFGGSQGADTINRSAEYSFNGAFRYIVIAGQGRLAPDSSSLVRHSSGESPPAPMVLEYSDTIWELFAAADLIVARAGALTISEIAMSGRASILVPSPNVTNNHQYYNAKVLADAGAAVLITEDASTEARVAAEIGRLAGAPDKVKEMELAAIGLARPDATRVIVDEIFG